MITIWHHIRMLELLHAGGEQCVAVIRLIWQSCLDSFNDVSLQAAKRWWFSFLQYSVPYEDDWRLFLAICNSVYESPAVQPWSKTTWTAPRSTWIFRVDPAMAAAWAMPDMRAMQAVLLVARPNYINCMTTWWLHVKFANASTTSSQTPCNYIK